MVHLSLNSRGGTEKNAQSGNRVDHVAFFGFDLEKTLAHLDSLGVRHEKLEERLYLNEKMVQVFLEDPNGIKVELGFFAQREKLFRESMEEYQAKARAGDAQIRGGK